MSSAAFLLAGAWIALRAVRASGRRAELVVFGLAAVLAFWLAFDRRALLAPERRAGWIVFAAILAVAFAMEGWRIAMPDAAMRAYFANWKAHIGELAHLDLRSPLLSAWLGWMVMAAPVLLFLSARQDRRAALMLVLSMLLPIWFYGFAFGARVHLFVNEGRYAEMIRQLSQIRSAEEKNRLCGETCGAHPERQIVIFHYCHCPFFWPDLVYDPGGALRANRDELQKLNFHLHDARHLTTFWYIGYFGD